MVITFCKYDGNALNTLGTAFSLRRTLHTDGCSVHLVLRKMF